MSSGILDELGWRGLIAQSTDLDALAAEARPMTVYAGFDPTAPSLHAGHLVPLLALRRFQRAGHRPIVLAGGATGMIGDPRDVGERTLNEADTVAEWTERIRGQLERFVDFDESDTGAVVVNNLDWTRQLSAIEFLRDLGKHFSVNVMLDRDTVRRRLEGDGISYTEFSYMLLQANDYVELHRRYGCVLQIGGSDQWGNIIAGVRLVRQKLGATVHALTVPLVTAADGTKFGKSTGGGSLWLDPALTTPYAWYQYFFNTADADVIRYLRWFTFLSADELGELERATAERPQQRAVQAAGQRADRAGARRGRHRSGRARQPGAVRAGRAGAPRRSHAGGGAARDVGRRAQTRCARRDRRPVGGQRPVREPQGRPAHPRRGRRLGQQRAHRPRGLGAATVRLPARQMAGAAPRQAHHRRGGKAVDHRRPDGRAKRVRVHNLYLTVSST